MKSKEELAEILEEVYGYPRNVVVDMCNYFSSQDLEDYITWLADNGY